MAHELTIRADGFVEMGYLEGVQRWHGLGNELKPGASIEEWRKQSGLDYRVLRSKIRYNTVRGEESDAANWRCMDDMHVFFRNDTGAALGIGSAKFKLVQPGETLEFFRDLVGAAGFELQTAGSLFDGRKYWAMASTNKEAIILDKRDKVRANLLCSTACDGSMATVAKFIAGQVVCNNTLQGAMGERGGGIVKVTHRTTFDAKAVKAELGVESAMSAFDRTVDAMRRMAETRMSHEAMILATCGLFKPGYLEMTADEQAKVLRTKPVEPVARMACDNTTLHADMDGGNGTVYGWLNAVTEYVDHQAVAKGEFKADNRMDSAWFGRGADVKEKAFAMASDIATATGKGSATDSVNAWLAQHS